MPGHRLGGRAEERRWCDFRSRGGTMSAGGIIHGGSGGPSGNKPAPRQPAAEPAIRGR